LFEEQCWDAGYLGWPNTLVCSGSPAWVVRRISTAACISVAGMSRLPLLRVVRVHQWYKSFTSGADDPGTDLFLRNSPSLG